MPKINSDHIDDMDDFSPLPEGQYLCRLAEVEEASTQYGDDLWKLKFAVAEGPCQGCYIFDNLVFSQAALKRVKLVCSRLFSSGSGCLRRSRTHAGFAREPDLLGLCRD